MPHQPERTDVAQVQGILSVLGVVILLFVGQRWLTIERYQSPGDPRRDATVPYRGPR